MAQGHCTSKDIHHRGIQPEQFHIDQGHHTESFVDFVVIDIGCGNTRMLQCHGNCQGWSRRKINGSLGGIPKAQDSGNRLGTHVQCILFGHEDECTGSIIETAGIGGRDGSIGSVKGGFQGLNLLNLNRPRFLVLCHQQGIASALRNLHGNDFLKDTSLQCFIGPPVGFNRVLVLFVSGYIVVVGTLFSAHAHVLVIIKIP
mmetsp:Transcript_12610/g.26025  ORF Transcript_12610/g.26025 Transcript_12610/m.26025 type:complete len:201 (+) Transcript_12610:1481-2083(+)